jgi:hypothetical protein
MASHNRLIFNTRYIWEESIKFSILLSSGDKMRNQSGDIKYKLTVTGEIKDTLFR